MAEATPGEGNESPKTGDAGDSGDVPARILVVDDDDLLRVALGRGLRLHAVVSAPSASAALERFELGERFDIVFCDVVMPEMTGPELFDRVYALDRDQAERFVFLTGGIPSTETEQHLAATARPVLTKPVSLALLRALARAARGG